MEDFASFTVERTARILANIARYNGDFPEGIWYSVGHHAVLLARHVRRTHPDRPDWALAALHHDDGEAQVGGDVVAPLRKYVPELTRLQDAAQARIFAELGLSSPDLPEAVAEYDIRIRADEGPICRPDLPVAHWTRYGAPLGIAFPSQDLCIGGRPGQRRGAGVEFRSCPRRVTEAYLALHEELLTARARVTPARARHARNALADQAAASP